MPNPDILLQPLSKVRALARILFYSAILTFVCWDSTAARPSEYQVKSAYIYNFTKFIQWPETSFIDSNSPYRICVMGDNPELNHIKQLNNRITRGRTLMVIFLPNNSSLENCHILYFSQLKRDSVLNVLQSIKNKPIVTVGEYTGFAEQHGVIEFSIDTSDRVRLLINLDQAKRNQIKISAQLLEVASVIGKQESAQ